ncbi:MAG: acyl-CoA-binding protein [Flavobacteriales bacterium]|jgi:diazepam-binding inhibitor (GABA receptor modulator, acyl-CoA-binding protein)|nr:acyl-CoA-binding protein [Flavobacteriales bacterium]
MKSLKERFEIAYQKASKIDQSDLPPDIMLRLYAYYKLATKDSPRFSSKSHERDVRNAFKFNAWMQLKGVSIKESKEEYINIVEAITKEKIE